MIVTALPCRASAPPAMSRLTATSVLSIVRVLAASVTAAVVVSSVPPVMFRSEWTIIWLST